MRGSGFELASAVDEPLLREAGDAAAPGFGRHILQGVQAGGRSVETRGLGRHSDVMYRGPLSLQGL